MTRNEAKDRVVEVARRTKSQLGEALHTAFRKAGRTSRSTKIHTLIDEMSDEEWAAILGFVIEGLGIGPALALYDSTPDSEGGWRPTAGEFSASPIAALQRIALLPESEVLARAQKIAMEALNWSVVQAPSSQEQKP